jgi:hypothetical protein
MVLFLSIWALAAAATPARAVSYYLATDVPATLGGTDHTPGEILRSDGALYSVALSLPNAEPAAMHRRADGLWLLAPSTPFFLGSVPVRTHDVVATFDGSTFSVFFDGIAAGIPDSAGIDALLLDSGGALVFSFNVPVNLDGTEYGASDLVRYSGGAFSLFWNAGTAGVPAYANLVGADRDSGGNLVIDFDVPTRLGASDYLPGQLVRWDGGTSFSSYFTDPAWPAYAQLRDFGFVPASGAVPDGGVVPGTPLTVRLTTGNLTLSWGASCAIGDSDYEVYEGALVSPFVYNHAQRLCTTGGATTATFAAPAGNAYYLVVPKNAVSEGSYGRASSGDELPRGAPACLPQQIAATCP